MALRDHCPNIYCVLAAAPLQNRTQESGTTTKILRKRHISGAFFPWKSWFIKIARKYTLGIGWISIKKNSWGRLSLLSALQIMLSLSLHPGTLSLTTSSQYRGQKSDNLQYNMLGGRVAGTNYSSTKRLMFQVLFFSHYFLQNSLQTSFQFFLYFIINIQK